MKKFAVILLLMLPLWSHAQLLLKGVVKAGSLPAQGANVILTGQDGKIITGAATKEDGSFALKAGKGGYRLKISFLGFVPWEKAILLEQDTDLGAVHLQPGAGRLREVGIVAKKKLVEYKPDRLVLNVENNISAAGGNALDAISAAPGVVVQQNTINILGKGASRVMIDGRIVELSGDELAGYLKAIPAGDIKSIEVITNPPAQYEANTGGGLINIRLKKGVKNSWKSSSTLSYNRNSYNFYALGNTFLYNRGRVRLAAGVNGKAGHSKVMQSLTTAYPGGPWVLRYQGKQQENSLSGRMALDYDLSDKTSIGFQYAGSTSSPDSRDNTDIKIYSIHQQPDSLLINTGNRDLYATSHTANAHVIYKLDSSGKALSVDADYFTYRAGTDNRFTAEIFSPAMQYLGTDQSARNISRQHIDNGSLKVDMTHPLRSFTLSYGARASYTRSRGAIAYFNTITGIPVQDPDRSNEFVYKENNQAAYINAAAAMGRKFSVQAGIRVENTQTTGYSNTLKQTTRNNYLKWFPSCYVAYNPGDRHSFILNYGRKINRPGFSLLNPFRSYINSTSYSEGNPFLRPSFSDNFELAHVWKGVLRSTALFNMVTDGFGPVFTSDPEKNTLAITRQNYFREYYYGIGENYTGAIAAWWQCQYSLYLLGSSSSFDKWIHASPQNGFQLYLTAGNTFALGGATKVQVDLIYSSPFKRGLYEFGARSGLNIGMQQSLLKNRLQLSIFLNDIFNTAFLKDYTSVVNGIKQVYNENNSSRFCRLSLTYHFGNDRISVKQRSFGNDDERRRTN